MSLGSFLGGLNLLTLLAAAHHPDSIHCSLVSHLSQAVTSVALAFLTALTISPSFPDLRYKFALHSGTGSGSVSHSIFFLPKLLYMQMSAAVSRARTLVSVTPSILKHH